MKHQSFRLIIRVEVNNSDHVFTEASIKRSVQKALDNGIVLKAAPDAPANIEVRITDCLALPSKK